jgi:hypothetical protein
MDLAVKSNKPPVLTGANANISTGFVIENQPRLRIGLREINLNEGITVGVDGNTLST